MKVLCLCWTLVAAMLAAPGTAHAQSEQTITLPAAEASLASPSVHFSGTGMYIGGRELSALSAMIIVPPDTIMTGTL